MKKLNLILLIVLGFSSAKAQQVFKAKAFIENKPVDSYFFHIRMDDKDAQNEWKEYLGSFGTTKETSKDHYTSSGIKLGNVSIAADAILSRIVEHKDYSTIYVTFLDQKGNYLNNGEVDQEQATFLLEEFIKTAYKNEEKRLAKEDYNWVEDQFKDAEKEVSKIESRIKSNLKAQEKLGSKLNQTAEDISAQADQQLQIDEKLNNEEITEEEAATLKEEKASILDKFTNKDKALERSEKRLEKKENELLELKEELLEAKFILEEHKAVYEGRKKLIDSLL